jgi:hypothetical protein
MKPFTFNENGYEYARDIKILCSGTLGTILSEKSSSDSTKPVESNSIVFAKYES